MRSHRRRSWASLDITPRTPRNAMVLLAERTRRARAGALGMMARCGTSLPHWCSASTSRTVSQSSSRSPSVKAADDFGWSSKTNHARKLSLSPPANTSSVPEILNDRISHRGLFSSTGPEYSSLFTMSSIFPLSFRHLRVFYRYVDNPLPAHELGRGQSQPWLSKSRWKLTRVEDRGKRELNAMTWPWETSWF